MNPDFKRATRPSGLHAVPDCQRAERIQAGPELHPEYGTPVDRLAEAYFRSTWAWKVLLAIGILLVAFTGAVGAIAFGDFLARSLKP